MDMGPCLVVVGNRMPLALVHSSSFAPGRPTRLGSPQRLGDPVDDYQGHRHCWPVSHRHAKEQGSAGHLLHYRSIHSSPSESCHAQRLAHCPAARCHSDGNVCFGQTPLLHLLVERAFSSLVTSSVFREVGVQRGSGTGCWGSTVYSTLTETPGGVPPHSFPVAGCPLSHLCTFKVTNLKPPQ